MKRRDLSRRILAFLSPRRSEPGAVRAAVLGSAARWSAAQATISAFYAALFFLSANHLYSLQELLAVTELSPRWPVFWLRFVDLREDANPAQIELFEKDTGLT